MIDETTEYGGEGVERLQQSTDGVKLRFDKDSPLKVERRQRLLKQLYHVAMLEQQFVNDQIGMWTRSHMRKIQSAYHRLADDTANISLWEPISPNRVKRQRRPRNSKSKIKVQMFEVNTIPSGEGQHQFHPHTFLLQNGDAQAQIGTPQYIPAENSLNLTRSTTDSNAQQTAGIHARGFAPWKGFVPFVGSHPQYFSDMMEPLTSEPNQAHGLPLSSLRYDPQISEKWYQPGVAANTIQPQLYQAGYPENSGLSEEQSVINPVTRRFSAIDPSSQWSLVETSMAENMLTYPFGSTMFMATDDSHFRFANPFPQLALDPANMPTLNPQTTTGMPANASHTETACSGPEDKSLSYGWMTA